MKKDQRFNPYQAPYLLLTLAVLFWSGNFILGRAVRADIPPVALAFWRWTIAAMLLLPLSLPQLKRDWRMVIRHGWLIILFTLLGVASFNTLVYLGLHWTIVLNAFLMQSMMPVMIVAMSFLIFRERISLLQTSGIALSLAGALLIIVRGDSGLLFSLALNKGDLLVFLALLCYAGYSVLLRRRPMVHPLSFLWVTFMLGSLMLLPLWVWETVAIRSIPLNRVTFLSIGYVAVFPSIISYFCYNRGVELVGANRAGLFMHLMPVFGSIMAMVFLGESLHWFHGTGIFFIAVGIVLSSRSPVQK